MALVFGKCDFTVHPLNDFIVLYLLLDVEFGQFGRVAWPLLFSIFEKRHSSNLFIILF